MCYATPVQPKIGTDKIIQRYTHSTLFTLSENDFRCLHLDDWKSLRRYHRTLHPHNLTFTTSIKFDFRILHLHNLKSLLMIWLTLHSHILAFTTFVESLQRYHCTLHLHNLTFTTSIKFDFRILLLHNLKSLSLW